MIRPIRLVPSGANATDHATHGQPVSDQGWGLLTAIALPGGVELGLYQPRHPTAAQSS